MLESLYACINFLEDAGELVRVQEKLSPRYEVAAALRYLERQSGKAVLLERVEGYEDVVVLGNLLSNRRRLALLLDVPEDNVVDAYLARTATPVAIGLTWEEWHRQIFAGLGIPYSYEMAVRLNDRFMRGFAGRTRPVPGAAEVLGRLARQYRLGVVSNSMAENTLIDLARTGLRQYFHVLIISSQVGYRKPHPVIYLAALQAMNVAPEEVVFVGDNWEEDVVGPKEHGMQAIWLKPAGKEAEEWRFRLPGVAVAGALEDIPGMLLKPGG
ncbi:MAG: HAD family hydrolase [Clostridia bacterium]|nr:MAG: HAD family hydrolase [Clostridia bacterium]